MSGIRDSNPQIINSKVFKKNPTLDNSSGKIEKKD